MKTLLLLFYFLLIQLSSYSQTKLPETVIKHKDTFLLIKPSQAKQCVDYKKQIFILGSLVKNYDSIIVPRYENKVLSLDSVIIEKEIQAQINLEKYVKTNVILQKERDEFLGVTKKLKRQRLILSGISIILASLLIIK